MFEKLLKDYIWPLEKIQAHIEKLPENKKHLHILIKDTDFLEYSLHFLYCLSFFFFLIIATKIYFKVVQSKAYMSKSDDEKKNYVQPFPSNIHVIIIFIRCAHLLLTWNCEYESGNQWLSWYYNETCFINV